MTDAQNTYDRAPTGGNRRAVNRATQLRRTSHKADCIDQALAALRADRSLHLQHRNGNARWSLSDGQSVTADVAAILTCSALVVPAGNALFSDMPGQTWRYVQ